MRLKLNKNGCSSDKGTLCVRGQSNISFHHNAEFERLLHPSSIIMGGASWFVEDRWSRVSVAGRDVLKADLIKYE